METLTAYVRERSPRPPAEQPSSPRRNEDPATDVVLMPATDIQAVLTVISRRHREHDAEKRGWLDLHATDLRGAYLIDAHLEGANLGRAHLEKATLHGAHLERTSLRRAHLEGASLIGAHIVRAGLHEVHLEGAKLWNARLNDSDLWRAHLEGAELSGADFEKVSLMEARLDGADLRRAKNLTQRQLDVAYGDKATKLPAGLTIRTEPPDAAD